MSNTIESIKERRSVRKYEDREIPEDVLGKVLDSIRWSPSWANTQCWEIVLVKDPETKEKLQKTLPEKGNPALKAMVAAPVVVVVCGKLKTSGYYKELETTKFGDWFMYDLGIATQTICLAAHHLGLGTVIVGLFDHNRAKDVLNVPEGYELVTMIPMGYPAKKTSAPKRRDVNDFVHRESF